MAVTENVFLPIGSAGGPASGSTDFTFTFEYLNKNTDIKVSLNGVNTSAYTFPTGSVVRFNTAPADGVVVRIYRDTDIDTARAVFAPGSVIRAQDLNDNFEQIRFVTQETDNNTWDNETETVKSTNTWVSSDEKVATTAAIDARFQDEIGDTLISSEAWVSSDDYIATTRSIDQRIDTAITNDVAGSDGVTITDDGDGTITVGLANNSVDFSKIKDEDIITYAEQEAGSPSWLSDTRIPTTFAAARRFDTIVQTSTPVGINWEVGKTWLQNDQDLTLSIWNGTNWLAIASGGAFINQPKVVYVDASSGNDSNDGHRISRPKKTVKAAINQINADAIYGDGSVVVVAPGTYQEVAPIDITKKDVSIIGTALRSCVIHPTPATETNSLFRVNSGTFLQNLTFTGVKASGTRGEVGSVDPDPVYGLPGNQGWNVSFYPGAMIYKSPYIQNCTNFSDSEIDNGSLNPHTPAGGAAGDTDSAMTGGGLLVDGSTVNASSPLRSMVCDSYTHVGLDGPGILVTNNGYAQCTSSYAFFNHYHIKALNGGQANLAASTTDFGRYALVVDGRSTNAIFTATTTVDANSGDISFTIGTPVAGSPWHGSATRPQSNMLVDIGGNTYPILSATPNGAGWDVVISRPNPSDRSQNLGLDGAVLTGATVEFYLRSMIASSGHTMEYVGSGTNYAALPENGGVPVEVNQVVELNNGKIWTATTDHNGKFKVGDFFTVDQQTNAIYISSGSFNVDLQNLQVNPSGNAVIGANLDLNGSNILDSTGNVTIADTLDMNSNAIINVQAPTSGSDAANKTYVDTKLSLAGGTMTGALGVTAGSAASPSVFISADTNTGIYSPGADQLAISTNGTGRLFVDSSGRVGIGTTSPGSYNSSANALVINTNSGGTGLTISSLETNKASATTSIFFADGTTGDESYRGIVRYHHNDDAMQLWTAGSERLRIDSSGRLLVGTSSAVSPPFISGTQTGPGSILANGYDNGRITIVSNSFSGNNVRPASLALVRTGSDSNTTTNIAAENYLGSIDFIGRAGNAYNLGATIYAAADGGNARGLGSGDMPSRVVFAVSNDNSASPTERYRITPGGQWCFNQSAPPTRSATTTISPGDLQNGLILSNPASGITFTLASGSDIEGQYGGIYTGMAFEWSIININATNTITISNGTNHTYTGRTTISANTSARFLTRRSATQTFVTYRIA